VKRLEERAPHPLLLVLTGLCNQVPAGARNPPTRDAREARSFKANGLSLRGPACCLTSWPNAASCTACSLTSS
jgi:hypothetical protein